MRPLMPPAALMSSIASSPALRIADPGSAYGPVKGPVIPTLITPPPEVLELPHAPMTNKASAARLVTRSRRLIIDNLPFDSAARAVRFVQAHARPTALFPIFFGARVRRRQATTPSTGAQYQIGHCDCQARFDRCLDFAFTVGRFVIARRVSHDDWIAGTSAARDLDRPGHR